jgi:aspartate-semialdehyde dehydrogenase
VATQIRHLQNNEENMADGYVVGIVGATGVVGGEMISILQERSFPVKELRLLASANSAGESIEFGDSELVV